MAVRGTLTREDQETIDPILGDAYLKCGKEAADFVVQGYLAAKRKYAPAVDAGGPPTNEFTVNARLAAPSRKRRRRAR